MLVPVQFVYNDLHMNLGCERMSQRGSHYSGRIQTKQDHFFIFIDFRKWDLFWNIGSYAHTVFGRTSKLFHSCFRLFCFFKDNFEVEYDVWIQFIFCINIKKRTTAFTRELREKNSRNWWFEEKVNFFTRMEPHMCLGIEQ